LKIANFPYPLLFNAFDRVTPLKFLDKFYGS